MLIQACLNGARGADFHPALPLDPAAMARAASACVAAGATALHLHPRDTDGHESLSADCLDATITAVRALLPTIPIGISTGEWIEADPERTLAAIAGWRRLPDFASVNVSETAAPMVFEALHRRGVGIEAGLSDDTDAERLLSLGLGPLALRLLVEIGDQDWTAAEARADAVLVLTAGVGRPRLLHGSDATVWPMLRKAIAACLSIRIGLEDGDRLPDGSLAADNAALIGAACALLPAGA